MGSRFASKPTVQQHPHIPHPAVRDGIFTELATSAQLSSIYLEETGLSCFKSSLPSLVVREWALSFGYYTSQDSFKLPESTAGRLERETREREEKDRARKDKGHLGLWSKSLRTSAASDQSSRAAALPPWLKTRTCTPAPREQRPASCAGDRAAPKAPPPGTGWQWRCR